MTKEIKSHHGTYQLKERQLERQAGKRMDRDSQLVREKTLKKS